MKLTEAAALPRRELPARLLQELSRPGPILLSGPSGSGKSHTLHELSRLLDAAGVDHFLVRHGDRDALARFEDAARDRLYLFDGLELADHEVLEALTAHIASGASGVSTIRNDLEAPAHHKLMQLTLAETPGVSEVMARMRNFRVAPLTRAEAEEIASLRHSIVLDSVTLAATIDLSWGRPGWLLDLLQLAAAGKVRSDPHPSVAGLEVGELHLAVLRRVSRRSELLLGPEDVAAGIVLSELEPRTVNGASDLVGSRAVTALIEARMLVESPRDPRLLGVPEIYGAVLRHQVDPVLLREAQQLATAQLLAQESLGIPLPDREAAFCARTPRHRAIDHEPDRPAESEAQLRTRARLLGDFASTLISFGRPEARDLLLRAHDAGALDGLSRLRATVVLSGPLEGLRALRAAPQRREPEASPPSHSSPPSLEEYGVEFLHRQLASEVDTARQLADHPREALRAELSRAVLVFERWNDMRPLGEDAAELLEIARSHPVAEVSLLAEQLLALEYVRHGFAVPPSTSRDLGERTDRIAALALGGRTELRDLLAAAAVAEGIITLLSAENISEGEMLHEIASRLPGTAYHELWVQHLLSALTALAAGSIGRAAQEWLGFERRIPRFLPLRLRVVISAIGAELQDPGVTPVEQRDPAHQLLAYFRGALDTMDTTGPMRDDGLPRERDAEPLPALRLAMAHLEALEAQNPSALLRVAEELGRRELWAPTAYALQAARSIFLRRRASGSVTRCDERLHRLEASVRERVPWFAMSSLPAAPRTRLTKRELDAAHLASAGLSNRQIAERIRCSARTVESHLASARAKLGASSRSELGRRMRDLGYV